MTPTFYQYAAYALLALIILAPAITKHFVLWPYLKRIAFRAKLRGLGWDASKMEYLYTDIFGNRWFRIKNIGEIAWRRAIEGQIACREAECCITPEYIKQAGQEMVDALNAGLLTKVAMIVTEIVQRSNYAAERETLTRLACVYFYLEGENINTTDERMNEKKRTIWKQDKEAQSFFLQSAYALIADTGNTYHTDIETYLAETEAKVNKYHLPSPKAPANSSKTSTSTTPSYPKVSQAK